MSTRARYRPWFCGSPAEAIDELRSGPESEPQLTPWRDLPTWRDLRETMDAQREAFQVRMVSAACYYPHGGPRDLFWSKWQWRYVSLRVHLRELKHPPTPGRMFVRDIRYYQPSQTE